MSINNMDMKRAIREALKEDSDYHRMSRNYPKATTFRDREKESGNIKDLTDDLENKGIDYEIYYDKKDNGCTVFYSREIRESIRLTPGETFRNAGFLWKILATKGDYTLVYAEKKKLNPYVVAWNLDKEDGSWGQGHYFDDADDAMKFMSKKDGLLRKI